MISTGLIASKAEFRRLVSSQSVVCTGTVTRSGGTVCLARQREVPCRCDSLVVVGEPAPVTVLTSKSSRQIHTQRRL